MRYIIELNGEEPTVTIEEILDRELGRNCICSYADYDKDYLDELAETYVKAEGSNWGIIAKAYKAGYKRAMEG